MHECKVYYQLKYTIDNNILLINMLLLINIKYMNIHSSKQQSMNAKRKNRNTQEFAIANDLEFDELYNFIANDS